MSKRVAVVTGGIGGLGTEICKYLARPGRKVVAADLASRDERVDAFREEMAEFGDDVVFEPLNVADFEACARTDRAASKTQHGPIDDPGQRRRHHPRHHRCAR